MSLNVVVSTTSCTHDDHKTSRFSNHIYFVPVCQLACHQACSERALHTCPGTKVTEEPNRRRDMTGYGTAIEGWVKVSFIRNFILIYERNLDFLYLSPAFRLCLIKTPGMV